MRNLRVIGLLASAALYVGCSSGSNGATGASAAFDVVTIDPGKECVAGGERVKVGLDDNHDGTLEDSEVTDTYVTCNGSTLGNDGATPLIVTAQEPPGKHCKAGGVSVETGIDQDGDGKLSADEVDKTTYVCAGQSGTDGAPGTTGADGADGKDGKPGTDGTNGTNGMNGQSSLISTSAEPPGSHCASGGASITGGLDVNADGILEPGEITNTAYACNGATSLVRTSFESPGSNCLHGGFRIDTGTDTNLDGSLSDPEVKTTNYVCNGANGLNGGADGLSSLVKTSAEPAGSHCPSGGVRIDMGIDDNENTVLDPSEVDSSSYVCAGSNGSNGLDGALSLVRLTAEPAGAHCATGGVKVDSGVDDNRDTVLQAAEVDTTSYVCNGSAGLNGTNGLNGLGNLLNTSVELPGANCATGGFKLASGPDSNGNGLLDSGEVTNTSYVCNGINGLAGVNGINGINGVNALNSLVKTVVELPGANCAAGGFKISNGTDLNANGVLDTAEVTGSNFLCNGLAGTVGVNGLTNLVKTVVELPGANCAAGGLKVVTGADLNSNGVLDSTEITASNFLCNGLNGLAGINGTNGINGLTSLTKTVLELPGANCASGGFKVSTGSDSNGNGVLDAAEATSSSYICNGINGLSGTNGVNGLGSLVSTAIELPGAHCATGGFKVSSGLDTNLNLVLDAGEVTATNYLCNGINGLAGLNGTNGSNGSNGLASLVSTTVELPGTNCLLGGLKVGSGLDTNKNGVLDPAEVTSTNYVCNGQTGSSGATGSTGLSSAVKTSLELPGAHCLLGGLRVDTGIDTNKNGVLDTAEITGTTYMCTLGS